MVDDLDHRRGHTFKEAEGITPPIQLQGHRVTKRLRIILLELLSITATSNNSGQGFRAFRRMWMMHLGRYGSDFPDTRAMLEFYLKDYITKASDVDILDLIQYFCRDPICKDSIFESLQEALKRERIAYRLIGEAGNAQNPPTLVPVATPEQAEALVRDFDTVSRLGNLGATEHLRLSAEAISAGNFRGSIREGIHAVESSAKAASGKERATLPDALKALSGQKALHPALRQALDKLYGWSSDEQGIRHALIDPNDDVSEHMALFMLSACAAFSAWLLSSESVEASNNLDPA